MAKPKSPKDPNERLEISLLGLKASAVGRFPTFCLAVIVVAGMIGRALGVW